MSNRVRTYRNRVYAYVDTEVDVTDQVEELAEERVQELAAAGSPVRPDRIQLDRLIVRLRKAKCRGQAVNLLLSHIGDEHVSRAFFEACYPS